MLQEFKTQPAVRGILEGGERVAWGAKAIPEGGWWAMPKLTAPGLVLCGDTGGMVNVPSLKGIHYAIQSGILAAEAIVAALRAGSTDLSPYEQAVEDSVIGRDLYRSRNMKQPFAKGFFVGGAIVNAMVTTQGPLPRRALGQPPRRLGADGRRRPQTDGYPKPDGKLHLRQALERLHQRQRHPRRRAQPHPRAPARAARDRRDVALDVPGRASTRSPTTRPRTATST